MWLPWNLLLPWMGSFCVPGCLQDKITVSLALASLDSLEFSQRNMGTTSIS